ncbi:MAG: hypothetical protein AAB215_08435 [Planctomycetota bacterium]|mgnify:CR=1 FL=1
MTLLYRPDLEEVIDRHRAWWSRGKTDRPLVFVDESDVGVRTSAHQAAFWRDPDGFAADFEARLARRVGIPDDRIPILRPPFSHAALPGILGADVREVSGALWAAPFARTPADVLALSFDPERPFARQFRAYYERLLDLAAGRFVVAVYETPGPVSFAGSLLGTEEFILLCADDPELALAVCRKAADLAVRFCRWTNGIVSARQESFGGVFLSTVWAPGDAFFWSDHSALHLSPALLSKVLLPAGADLHESFERSFFFCYPGEGPHVFPALWRILPKLQGIHDCQGDSPDPAGGAPPAPGADSRRDRVESFYRAFAGQKSFLVKCPSARIPRFREILGDAGLGIWTFAEGPEAAKRLIDSL